MKFLSRSSLALATGLVAASVVGFAGSAQAQDATIITVEIEPVCEFVDVPDDDTQSVQTVSDIVDVSGSIVVQCNDPNGFTVSAESDNGGFLDATGITQTISYTVTTTSTADFTADTVSNLGLTTSSLGTVGAFSDTCAATTGCALPIAFDINNSVPVPTGTYSDTITYTVAAT